MNETSVKQPPRWLCDPETGVWRRAVIHNMLRRCRNWDYCGTGVYLITLVLNDRSHPILGRLDAQEPRIDLTALGQLIEAHFNRISEFTPEIEVLGVQLMPEHLHGVLRVARRMAKPLGEQLRGFKIGATKIAREMGLCSAIDGGAQRGLGLFADGFTDTILFDADAVEKGLGYIADNPRRLWEKRRHPTLFRVLRDLRWRVASTGHELHFAAIGNQALLDAPQILQVQCSRSHFTYAKAGDGSLLKDRPPVVETAMFREKAETMLAATRHGAVLVSPCISHGEKEIARLAFAAGAKVITLANKGFSPLYKPGGKLFDQCANGNLLMLAPAAWPYLPGKKPITRIDACVLNRIAQLIAGNGAVEIDYKGARMSGIEEAMFQATEVP